MNNILFSTTCQWNPGDELIFQGVLNILRDSGLLFNAVLYNRNPAVNPPRSPDRAFRDEADFLENSFYLAQPAPVDYVVFAGSPEWAGGPRIDPLLEFIIKHGLRCSFLGVGLSGMATPSSLLRSVLQENTDVFACRDKMTLEMVTGLVNAQLLACPSLLSSKTERHRKTLGRVGCGIQGTKVRWQNISREYQKMLYDSYLQLAENYPLEYIAHYIDDLNYLPHEQARVHYSGRTVDFFQIYDQFDLIVSPRLHGCGIAASLGIPSICLAHDQRGVAAELFGAVVVNSPQNLNKIVAGQDWALRSKNILDLKISVASRYQSVIQPIGDYLNGDAGRISRFKPAKLVGEAMKRTRFANWKRRVGRLFSGIN